MSTLRLAGAVALAVCAATPALAHSTLAEPQAVAGTYFVVSVKVPHGCEGTATQAVRVRIPAGVFGTKPQPKPGWELAVTREKLAEPLKGPHGETITERVSEVTWTGGNLPDQFFDEFRMQVRLPNEPGTTLYWPIVQECEKGVHRWIEIPKPGQSLDSLKEPAAPLKLLPKP
ncbi:MAG: YcnI family copper-binding membrane protein [Ferrovibrionaceae bacterium]